jgi:Ca2+-binding EF-hand superfamily protein
VSDFCAEGYYCPTVYEKYECPRGNFCGVGYTKATPCAWGVLTCPNTKMSTISPGLSFFVFGLALVTMLHGFRYLILNRIKSKEAKYKAIAPHISHEEYDIIALEKEQKAVLIVKYKQMLSILNVNIDLPTEEILQIFDSIDTDHNGIIDMEEMKNALIKAGMDLYNDSIGVTLKNHEKISKEEFTNIWESIQDVTSSTTNSFKQSIGQNSISKSEYCFNKIVVPLNVSFDKLSLSLKNGSSVLSDVSGAIEAFKCSALMGPSGSGMHTSGYCSN